MRKIIFFLIIALSSTFSFGQNISISGKLLEKDTQLPLEAATVYLSSAADSTLVDYTITNKDGSFLISTKKITKPVILKVSFLGFKNYQKLEKELTESKDFGIIYMEDDERMLKEVVVVGEAPPVRVKSDTLEFNASSFKIRPDANVETLLKQLPGVEVAPDGKITVNGKEVNQVLVNGKPFFDKDGKIALQNLPSDMINKVQISDTKTKQEEISGKAATSNNSSINLTIDEKKNKGFFGKAMAGYGTDDRYESSLLLNYFKNNQKISVLGSSNNINSSGFSMNEIFDSMGGGRNNSFSSFGGGSYNINGISFGGGQGITQSDMIGINYADEFFKGFDFRAGYFYNSSDSNNKNRTKTVNFLPDGEFTTTSESVSKSSRDAHNFSSEIEYKIDSTATLVISPKFAKTKSYSRNNGFENSVDANGDLLNDNISNQVTDNDNNSFSNEIYFDKKLNNRGRAFGISFSNDNKKDENSTMNQSTTNFYDDDLISGVRTDQRNQMINVRNYQDNYDVGLTFREKIIDSLELRIGVDFTANNEAIKRNTLDFNPANNSYSIYNDTLTRYLGSRTRKTTPTAGLNWERGKYRLSFNAGTNIAKFDSESFYLGQNTTVAKDYVLPTADAQFNYKFTKSKSIWTSYNYETNFPTSQQILPVQDFVNPLNTVVGNEFLSPEKSHRIYFSFRDYQFATKSGYNLYGGGSYYDSQIISSTIFDASRKRTTTYQNVADTYNTWFGGHYSKTIKKDAHSFRYGFGVNGGVSKSKGFTNGNMYDALGVRLTPRVNFTYDYGELLSIDPTYSVTFSQTDYKNYNVESASNTTHRFNLQTTSYWPKNVVYGNDFGYDYNSNIADGFKKDFFLWNMSLGYNFLGEKLLAKVKVYDILNQNQSSTRTISATTIRDEENTVLQRYLMFSLTYKLDKFGGVKSGNSGPMRHM